MATNLINLSSSSFLSFLFFFLLFSSSVTSAGKCNKQDKKALLEIKAFWGNPYHLASWTNTTACCDWYGVDCDPFTFRVTGLQIVKDSELNGTIPPAIAGLPYLKTLLLNHLPGIVGLIPPELANLKNIELLLINYTNVSGPVPAWFSKLTTLTDLDLSFNALTGTIPPSLSMLPNLGALHLDRNRLFGPIPDSFGYFPKASPPSLYLSHNNLSGPIPSSLGEPEWYIIDLSRNKLTGDASFLFGSTKPTVQFDLSRNQLSFDLGKVTFPVNLTLLDLNHNKLYGKIPPQINQVTGLVLFNVSYNRLCGEIPAGNVTAKFDQYSYFHNKCLCGFPLTACK